MFGVLATRLGVISATGAVVAVGAFADGESSPKSTDLTLTLSATSNKAEYVLYEPVYVDCDLKNTTWQPIVADVADLSLSGDRLTVELVDGAGHRAQYYSGPIVERAGQRMTDFAPAGSPGDSMAETITVLFNDVTRKLAFERTGNYTIETKVYLGSLPEPKYAAAHPIRIAVVDPGAADRGLIEAVGGKEALVQILRKGATKYCGDLSSESCRARVQNLVARFHDSHYAPAIAFMVARTVGSRDKSPVPDARESVLLREFITKWPDHPLRPEATRLLSLALYREGRGAEAMEAVRQFEEEYPRRASPRAWLDALRRAGH